MGELGEGRWAVISERGCEAAGLPHAEAARLVRRLLGEELSGLCVVTDEAARRLRTDVPASPNGKPPRKENGRKPKRAAKK